MLTKQEKYAELWMIARGVLQDEKIDADEARVIKRWLEEHKEGDSFDYVITQLDGFLKDGWIDSTESKRICSAIAMVLSALRR